LRGGAADEAIQLRPLRGKSRGCFEGKYKRFFFEKKKQKTFAPGGAGPAAAKAPSKQKFFCFFFFKKRSAYLHPIKANA
jgi:hypothetical protein